MRQRATLKASERGKMLIQQARAKKGWIIDDERWLEEASKKIEPERGWDAMWNTQLNGIRTYADNISLASWKRFLQGKVRINANAFKAFCKVLDLNWEDVVEENLINSNINLEDAPKLGNFYGRIQELDELQQWLITEACQLAIIHGVGGIGKAALARQLVENVRNKYNYVIWCSLNSTPPFQDLLTKIVQFISNNQENLCDISLLIKLLCKSKCLLILENWEEIIDSDSENFKKYDDFLKRVAEETHKSSVLVLSREKPKSIGRIKDTKVRIKRLGVLSSEDAKELLRAEGLSGTEDELEDFSRRYSNPWILKKIAKRVNTVFEGEVSGFIEAISIYVDDDINVFLDNQFQRLSQAEKNLIYWIAIRRNSALWEQIVQDSKNLLSYNQLFYTINNLIDGYSLIQKNLEEYPILYTLDQVTLKFVTNIFVEDNYNQIIQIIQNQSIQGSELLISHSFITKDTEDEQLQEEQRRRIVKPLQKKLCDYLGDKQRLNDELTTIISPQQSNNINITASENIALLLSSNQDYYL
ncbi:MAG: hypothetical protein HC907_04160 [Richelia sp. SM1_7_0]|nr:hypothetical protein [Richelia sp. SM1_7_0]